MGKINKEKDEVNNINEQLQKNYKVINNSSWRLVKFVITITFAVAILIVFYDSYKVKNSQLYVEACNISSVIDEEFSTVINSINMNGYITVLEQYIKTTSSDKQAVKESIYYENAAKTLDNMVLVSEEIEDVFIVSFANSSVLFSGSNNLYVENYDYENQGWYDYNQINKDKAYLSNEFVVEELGTDKMVGIVRPIFDLMNDEPIGAVVYVFEVDYLKSVWSKAIKGNDLESLIRLNKGSILYTTKKIPSKTKDDAFIENTINSKWNITYRVENYNLNWDIITYCSIWNIILNGLPQLLLISVCFVLIFITFDRFIKKLKFIKVIRTGKEIKEILDLNKIQDEDMLEEKIEEIDVEEYEETPIEEVLEINEFSKKD